MAGFAGPTQFDIGFEQPIDQPSMVGAIGAAVGGLFGPPSSGGGSSVDERFTEAWEKVNKETSLRESTATQREKFRKIYPGLSSQLKTQYEASLSPAYTDKFSSEEYSNVESFYQSADGAVALAEARGMSEEEAQAFVLVKYADWTKAEAETVRIKREVDAEANLDLKRKKAWDHTGQSNQAIIDVAASTVTEIVEAVQMNSEGIDVSTLGLAEVIPGIPKKITAQNLPAVLDMIEARLEDQISINTATTFGMDINALGLMPEDTRKQVFANWEAQAALAKEGVSSSEINRLRNEEVRGALLQAGVPVDYIKYVDTAGFQSDSFSRVIGESLGTDLTKFFEDGSLDTANQILADASKRELEEGYGAMLKLMDHMGVKGYIPGVKDVTQAQDFKDKTTLTLAAFEERKKRLLAADGGIAVLSVGVRDRANNEYSTLFGGKNATSIKLAIDSDPAFAEQLATTLTNDLGVDYGQIQNITSQYGLDFELDKNGKVKVIIPEELTPRQINDLSSLGVRSIDALFSKSLEGVTPDKDVIRSEVLKELMKVSGLQVHVDVVEAKLKTLRTLGTFGKGIENTLRGVTPEDTAFAEQAVGKVQGAPDGTVQTTLAPSSAVEFIQGEEGLELTAYQDQAGVWTIGYGHTGPEVKEGMTITKAQADAYLEQDLAQAESVVESYVHVPISDQQRAALVSLAYNIGSGAFKDSTLVKLLNEGDYEGASNEFGEWRMAGGEVSDGLVARRAREKELFLSAAAPQNPESSPVPRLRPEANTRAELQTLNLNDMFGELPPEVTTTEMFLVEDEAEFSKLVESGQLVEGDSVYIYATGEIRKVGNV